MCYVIFFVIDGFGCGLGLGGRFGGIGIGGMVEVLGVGVVLVIVFGLVFVMDLMVSMVECVVGLNMIVVWWLGLVICVSLVDIL